MDERVGMALLALLAFGPTDANGSEVAGQAKPADVRISVTVDWEGALLHSPGLTVLRRIHHAGGGRIPLTHFLNPAYFTKADADPVQVSQQIRTAILPGDALELHVHGWKSVTDQAGIRYRNEPRYLGQPQVMQFSDGDIGYEVSLAAYEVEELVSLLHASKAILQAHGFELGMGFRSGGGVSSPTVQRAVAKAGYRWDGSPLVWTWLDEEPALQAAVKASWPDLTARTQPYQVQTPDGALLALPASGAFADFLTSREMVAHVEEAVQRSRKTGKPVWVVLGIHEETADEFGFRMETALIEIQKRWPEEVHFTTLSAEAEARLR